MCLPHGLRDMCMIILGMLALNEYGSGVILTGSVHYIGWCIVGRQAIWPEGVLVLNLHTIGATHICQIFASHIRGWMPYLIEARWGGRSTSRMVLIAAIATILTSIIFFMLTMGFIIVAIFSFSYLQQLSSYLAYQDVILVGHSLGSCAKFK